MSEPTYPPAERLWREVDSARTILELANAGAPGQDDDLREACAKLDNWLLVNDPQWAVAS